MGHIRDNVLEHAFKILNWDTKGINIVRNLTTFVLQTTSTTYDLGEVKQMLYELEDACSQVALKINFSKTIMTNHIMSEMINIRNNTRQICIPRSRNQNIYRQSDMWTSKKVLRWAAYARLKHVFASDFPTCLKKEKLDNGSYKCSHTGETLSLITLSARKLRITQRNMKRSMLRLNLRARSQIKDGVEEPECQI